MMVTSLVVHQKLMQQQAATRKQVDILLASMRPLPEGYPHGRTFNARIDSIWWPLPWPRRVILRPIALQPGKPYIDNDIAPKLGIDNKGVIYTGGIDTWGQTWESIPHDLLCPDEVMAIAAFASGDLEKIDADLQRQRDMYL